MGKKSWKSWKEENSKPKLSLFENWRKDSGKATVWLHTNSGIYQKGRHVIPYIKYNKEKNRDEVSFYFFNCHEDYDDLRYKNEAQHCPMELFMEWLSNQDDISDDTLIWDCTVGNTKRSMTKYDIIENWMNKFSAKLMTVLPIIDDNNPTEILVTEETISIEMGIFKAIADYEKKLLEYGENIELADPDINPYPFKWEYNPKASKPSEYYSVVALDRKKPSKEIKELLNSNPIDLSGYVTPGNSKKLRQIMEDHIVLENVPFDEIFANVKDQNNNAYSYKDKINDTEDEEVEEMEVEEDIEEETEEVVPESEDEDDEEETEEDDDEYEYEEVYECDVCGGEFTEDELKDGCPQCKKIEEEKKKKEEKKKPKRKRKAKK